MGRSYTPRYRVRLDGVADACRWAGRPTAANLRRFLADYNRSLLPGGVNHHLARLTGARPARWARVEENCAGTYVVCEVRLDDANRKGDRP